MENNNDSLQKSSSDKFEMILHQLSNLPLVKIDRATFLRKELQQCCTAGQIEVAIAFSPSHVGIPMEKIDEIALKHINLETAKVSGISFVSGIPGGFAMAGTIPADFAQYAAHILRIAQKISYLYGWQDISQFDETTTSLLTLFVGIMFGVEGAARAVLKISNTAAASAAKKIAAQSLTKGTIFPIVKKVSALLGVKMTKQTFAKGVSKAIPVLGGVVGGGLTLATFRPMALRLQKEMKGFKQARSDFFTGQFNEADSMIDLSVDDIRLVDALEEETETGGRDTAAQWKSKGEASAKKLWDSATQLGKK